jgi:hypothetical protein
MSRRGAPGVWSEGWTVMVDVSFLASVAAESDQAVPSDAGGETTDRRGGRRGTAQRRCERARVWGN